MNSQKYICVVCNYVYDPAVGIPADGIPAGTAFADIADDWECPDCGVAKADFEVMEEAA